MTPKARGRQYQIPDEFHSDILRLRREGCTIHEICQRCGWPATPARISAVQNLCLQHYGKRDYRGIDAGAMPGLTGSIHRRTSAT